VLLEAIAAEKPIVATGATGVVDVVVYAKTGRLSPFGDVRSLADNALRVLPNPGLGWELTRRAPRQDRGRVFSGTATSASRIVLSRVRSALGIEQIEVCVT